MSDSGRLAAAIAEVALDIADQLDRDGARRRELATLRRLLCGVADTPQREPTATPRRVKSGTGT